MNFSEKLQSLRKEKNITQQELAETLFVSRTAISKWESGKGYPSIDSLKLLAEFFSVTVDELLSCDQLMIIAEEDKKKEKNYFLDILFGLLDISVILFLFLPLFAQRTDNIIQSVSLLSLEKIAFYLKIAYFVFTAVAVIFGLLILSLQHLNKYFWIKNKLKISLIINTLGALLFIISMQPYAAVLLFVFLIIKVLLIIKR